LLPPVRGGEPRGLIGFLSQGEKRRGEQEGKTLGDRIGARFQQNLRGKKSIGDPKIHCNKYKRTKKGIEKAKNF